MVGRSAGLSRWWVTAVPLLVATGFALAPILADRSSKADLVNQFLLQGAVLTTILLVVVLVYRRWRAGIWLAACLLVQIVAIGPPRLAPGVVANAAASGPTIRLAFANVWASNLRRPEAATALQALDADILVMAEFVEDWDSDAQGLVESYPVHVDCRERPGCDVALLSRFPVIESDAPSHKKHYSTARATIATPIGKVAVVGAHLVRPIPVGQVVHQERHAALLAEIADAASEPVVLVGDFNSVPWGRVMRGLEHASDLHVFHGLEGTWPAWLPWPLRIPIDHVAVDDGLRIVSRQVVLIPGSDHRALVVELAATHSAGS